ncbi:MAG: hypothetical protein KF884_07935 [Fimbriimonadaceae bacterium]|nr:hypothetical protein [Fimbriimonadaceae bacterium]QYK57480.1 MAG: hypothetical protein KF884_07935 [Fimbriimonadaceae bacterium]
MLLAALIAPTVFFRTSTIDVTPPEALPLGGYTERQGAVFSEGGDRLWSRCVVFEQGGLRVAVVSLEALTVPEGLVEEVRGRLPANVSLLLTATHTHSAPDSQMLNPRMTLAVPGIASYQPRWLAWYAERIAGGVREALGSPPVLMTEARLAVFRPGLNRGRRAGARPDPKAVVVRVSGQNLFAWYSAHATIHEADRKTLSGDWPGVVASRLGCPVLTGPIGDAAPRLIGASAEERLSAFAERFLQGSSRAVGSRMDWAGGLAFHREPVRLGPPTPHPEFASAYKVPQPLAEAAVNRFAPQGAELTFLRLGSLLLIGFPGEPSSALGRRLESMAHRRGFETALVVSHANGWVGYVLEPADYDRGGYEGTLSFHGREASVRFVEAMARGLKQFSPGTRPGHGWAKACSSGRR